LLALIILFDQFPRNMFRGSPRAFASDARAVNLTKEGIRQGFDRSLTEAQLDFFYMPLMHSEALSDHDLLLEQGHGDNRYAQEHREIIARFGRFQRDALTEAGCQRIFTEQMSGAVTDRPALRDALEFARDGDTLTVWKLDRLARSMKQLNRNHRKPAGEGHWVSQSDRSARYDDC
jgi:hypothetical protein